MSAERTEENCEALAAAIVGEMDYDALMDAAIAHVRDWYLSGDADAVEEFGREWERLMGEPIKSNYDKGECPDCHETIADNIVAGQECKNCGHVFWNQRDYD